MQIFFSKDYDLPNPPSAFEIENLKRKLKTFQAKIRLTDGNFMLHTYDKPFPSVNRSNTKMASHEIKSEIDQQKKKSSLEKLTCYLTRSNPEDGDSLMGYPKKLTRDQFGRIHSIPILEILSYEGYMIQLMDNPLKVLDPNRFDQISLRTATGCEYNYWLPIFTTDALYNKYKQHILNAFSVFKFGIEGKKELDFELGHILNIFPCLLNKMVINLQKGVVFESVAAIEAYAHFLRLFIQLIEEFPILQKIIDRKVSEVLKDANKRNKKNLGDMGEFLIPLAFSSYSFKNTEIW